MLLKPVEDSKGVGVDVAPRDRVILSRDNDWRRHESKLSPGNPQILHLLLAFLERDRNRCRYKLLEK